MKNRRLFILILIIGFILRIYGINWDFNFHLHPDERMLIMVAERIHFFNQLNPAFFNYGSLPIYLLKGVTQFIDTVFGYHLSSYDEMLYVGRILSTIFDLGTIILIYKIAQFFEEKLRMKTKGLNIKQPQGLFSFKPLLSFPLLSSFFYVIAFFPIQNSHFFISDVFLTFFTTLLIYLLIKMPSFVDRKQGGQITKLLFFISFVFGAMMAIKFTAIIFYPIIIVVIVLTMKQWNNRIINLLIFHFSFLIFNFLFMPYAFLDYKKFLTDVSLQIKMNNDPYVFPYTLQYVETTPYFYYLKNIFFWGLGPIISVLSITGLSFIVETLLTSLLKENSKFKIQNSKLQSKIKNYSSSIFSSQLLIAFSFYGFYFLIIGRSSVKFMRYMLPIYPFLAIMAGYGLYQIQNSKFKIQNYNPKLKIINFKLLTLLLISLSVFWTLCFVNIYSQPHTRIAATEWILKNIPEGSTLAVEHWDDRLPLFGGEKYNFVELNLYDQPDNDLKWFFINQKLKKTDYIIIASNRLYVPLQKLNDCKKYKICYPKTAQYYRKLFSEKLGFKKIAEFAVYPKFSIFNFQFSINDQGADESFTVYDHPKVMVFGKI